MDASVPEAIAEAIGRVLLNPDVHATLSARSLARSELFSWEKCARQTLQILENVAGAN